MTVTVTSALAGPATARYSNVYGALVDLGVLSGLGAQDVTGSGDPVAPILNASQFYAPLTSSLILTRGTGNPTYTRATNAWEFDNEGKLILVPSGSARFGGGRMVHNRWAYSETPTNAYWEVLSGATKTTGEADPFGGTAAAKITINSGRMDNLTSMAIPAGSKVTMSFWAKANATGTLGCGYLDGAVFASAPGIALTTSWQRVHTTFTVGVNTLLYAYPVHAVGTSGITDVWLYGIQVEIVTGQADQTASEYVSTGVLSAPFHGAGVDGVKWFDTNKDGSAISESSLLGNHAEGARTNSLLHSRDLTNAAWAATNITPAKTATGIDNAPDSASTLTASAADATILQTLSLAAAARSFSAYVKRRTGTGSVYITRDGGTNWTDITSSLGASWTRVKIENTSVLNPSVGFKIATSGDAIDVDVCQDEAGAWITSPIITTSTTITRNDELLQYSTDNISDAVGSVLVTVNHNIINSNRPIIGMKLSSSSGIKKDSTNVMAVVDTSGSAKLSDVPVSANAFFKVSASWDAADESISVNGGAALSSAAGGGVGGTTLRMAADGYGTIGYLNIKNVYIWPTALTDAQLQQVTT